MEIPPKSKVVQMNQIEKINNEIEIKSNIKLNDDYKARDLINIIRAKNFPKKSGARFVDKGNVYEIRLDIELIGKKDET
jgi:hypothetical protein